MDSEIKHQEISNKETVLLRRLYCLFPDTVYTAQAVSELTNLGVSEEDMHTVANRKIDISNLPESKVMQKEDKGSFIEDMFWMVNLTIFFAALALFISDIFTGLTVSTLVPLVVIAVCVFFGVKMSEMPNINPEDFQYAVRRGEILLMIDVPVDHMNIVRDTVLDNHPEVIVGGEGWIVEKPGITV